jgi:peptidoglycan/xylan/chitin deacetylase (PgdA/CDA1 family)
MSSSNVNDSSQFPSSKGNWEESISKWKQRFYSLFESSGGARLLQTLGEGSGQRLYVLSYHRVDSTGHRPWLNPELINATPAQFKEQMALLRRHYHPVTAEAVLEAVNGGRKLPRYAVLVTVDDGYLDFQETILPICKEYSIRPVLFVPTGYVGTPKMFWWDQLYQVVYRSNWQVIETYQKERLSIASLVEKQAALHRLTQQIKGPEMAAGLAWLNDLHQRLLKELAAPVERCTLDWDELRAASKLGCDVAAHTHTHPIMSRISADQMRLEIRRSQEQIRTELGSLLPIFAYPDGVDASIGPVAAQIAREEGVQLAFTMMPGRADLERGQREYLPRLGVWSKLNLGHFHVRLTPAFAWLMVKRGVSKFK